MQNSHEEIFFNIGRRNNKGLLTCVTFNYMWSIITMHPKLNLGQGK